jgi:nucleoside phosphorylase
MQTLIVLPLREEVAVFRHACIAHGLVTADGTVGQLVAMRVPELGLTVVPGGLGKVQLAIQTQHVLDVSRTREVVICAGAAGALVDTLAVGDVVVATETVEHDIHNHFGPPLLPRFSGAATMIASLRGCARLETPSPSTSARSPVATKTSSPWSGRQPCVSGPAPWWWRGRVPVARGPVDSVPCPLWRCVG